MQPLIPAVTGGCTAQWVIAQVLATDSWRFNLNSTIYYVLRGFDI